MLPLNRCMFVDYPTDTAAYNRYGQYLFGDILLAAPLSLPGKGERKGSLHRGMVPGRRRLVRLLHRRAILRRHTATGIEKTSPPSLSS